MIKFVCIRTVEDAGPYDIVWWVHGLSWRGVLFQQTVERLEN